LERIENTTLKKLDQLKDCRHEVELFYETKPPKVKMPLNWKRESTSRYLEPAWLQGARGFDAARYRVLASQEGLPITRPRPEVLVATLGLTQAALAYGDGEVTMVLPVLENSLQPMTPFILFKQRYQHPAGGAVSAVFAALGILVDLGLKYRVNDFAFAYHGGRGFYSSGLLGLSRLCAAFAHVKEFAHQALQYLEKTSKDLKQNSRERARMPLELARLLVDFFKNPTLATLGAMARAKARVQAEENPPGVRAVASELLGTQRAIEEAMVMADYEHIQPPSEHLIKALGEVFRAEGDGKWIGAYINLERADRPERFYAEVAKILSRALAQAEKEKQRKWLARNLKDALNSLSSEEVLSAYNHRTFLAHKTAFLLRLLASMKYEAGRPAAAETAEGGEQ
jgi:hypothetical protein